MRASRLLLSSSAWFLVEGQALGRWDHRQAERLGDYRDLGLEFYNDALSYRPPWTWQQREPQPGGGAQLAMGAGSLNQREFIFSQKLSLATAATAPWQIAYRSERSEDPRFHLEQDATELSYRPPGSTVRYGLLAEAYSEKAFADLGLRFAYHEAAARSSAPPLFDLSVWWVDGFYESKKLERDAYRDENPWATELRLAKNFGPARLRFEQSLETPVSWFRPERDQIYRAAAASSAASLSWGVPEEEWYLDVSHSWRREADLSLSGTKKRAYQFRSLSLEAGLRARHGRASSQLAFFGLGSELEETRRPEAELIAGPERRRELAAFGSWELPWEGRPTESQVLGLFLNRAYIRSDAYRISTELKAQWAYAWAIGEQGRFLLGTTWDIDQLLRDFPYRQHGFRPWGGGYAQLIAYL